MNFELPEDYDFRDKPVMVPVAWLLQNTFESVDFGGCAREWHDIWWENIIKHKASDTGFGYLVESIMEKGWVGGAIGWVDRTLTEGHHRLVAAILLGLDEVPITAYGEDAFCEDVPEGAECAHWVTEGIEPKPIYMWEFA